MSDDTPPPPPGFTVENDESAPAASDDPPPPPGFTVEEDSTPSGGHHITAGGLLDTAVTGLTRAAGSTLTNFGKLSERAGQPYSLPGESGPATHGEVPGFLPRVIGRAAQTAGNWLSTAQPGQQGSETGQALSEDLEPVARAIAPVVAPVGNALSAVDTAQRGALGNEKAEALETLEGLFTPGLVSEAAGATGRFASQALRDATSNMERYHPLPPAPVKSAQEVLDAAAQGSGQSMGAAATAPSLEGTSPELQQAVANSTNPDLDVVRNHADAETLPLPEGMEPFRYTKGQATGNGQQISDELNFRGAGTGLAAGDAANDEGAALIQKTLDGQNDKQVASLGEIRKRATPDVVGRNNLEHGQAGVDQVRGKINEAILDTRAKYEALADANAGNMPIDTGATQADIKDTLAQEYLSKKAAAEPVISEVMDDLASGNPMSFQRFENARSNLAAVQRGADPNAAKAAGIVRNALENMPLSSDVAEVKQLANTARAAAKSQFDTIEQNPAYHAVENENVPRDPKTGLHVIGAPSPLADKFMDTYFLGNGQNASRAYIARMQKVMQARPEFAQAVEAASLNKLSDAAGITGKEAPNFQNAKYIAARNVMDPKADVLMSPQSAVSTDQLKRVAERVSWRPRSSTVNAANTAAVLARYGAEAPGPPTVTRKVAGIGTDLGLAAFAPHAYPVKKVIEPIYNQIQATKVAERARAAKLRFAQDATAPGAGIERAPRAAGGRTTRDAGSHPAGAASAPAPSAARAAAPASASPRGAPASRGGTGPHQDRSANRNTSHTQTSRRGTAPTHRTGTGIERTWADSTTKRASGGKVDHEALVSRLMSRWHAARKAASKHTEPLLNYPDETIKRALDIAGSAGQ
jgi:hypothetical protein